MFISHLNNLGGISKYQKNQVIFDQGTPGTYQLQIYVRGTYYIEIVGGGGGGANSPGGSAAVYIGNAFLNAGIYNIQVGAGGGNGNRNNNAKQGSNSLIENLIICGCGFGGQANREGSVYRQGEGGDISILNSNAILQPQNAKKGINATKNIGANPTVYSEFIPNTYCGSGGYANTASSPGFGGKGGDGYVKITFLDKKIIKGDK